MPVGTEPHVKTVITSVIRNIKSNPEYKKKQKDYVSSADQRAKQKIRMANWRAVNIEKVREANVLRYGITLREYKQMFEDQKGKCATCGCLIVAFGGKKKDSQAHIDHDHVTNMVRELLCMQCNVALGAVKDSKETLASLISYLEKHKAVV